MWTGTFLPSWATRRIGIRVSCPCRRCSTISRRTSCKMRALRSAGRFWLPELVLFFVFGSVLFFAVQDRRHSTGLLLYAFAYRSQLFALLAAECGALSCLCVPVLPLWCRAAGKKTGPAAQCISARGCFFSVSTCSPMRRARRSCEAGLTAQLRPIFKISSHLPVRPRKM